VNGCAPPRPHASFVLHLALVRAKIGRGLPSAIADNLEDYSKGSRPVMHLSNQAIQVISTVVLIIGALAVIAVRWQAAKRPTSARKIMIPALGMISGFLMFVIPILRVPWLYALIAFAAGWLLSPPLIWTSQMRVEGDKVYLRRSPAFILVLIGLLIVRLILDNVISKYVTLPQTGGMFFILAFGMLLPWRIVMLLRYRSIVRQSDLRAQRQ